MHLRCIPKRNNYTLTLSFLNLAKASWMPFSVFVSKAEVASSNNTMGGSLSKQRAIATLLCTYIWKEGVSQVTGPSVWLSTGAALHSCASRSAVGPITIRTPKLWCSTDAKFSKRLRTFVSLHQKAWDLFHQPPFRTSGVIVQWTLSVEQPGICGYICVHSTTSRIC